MQLSEEAGLEVVAPNARDGDAVVGAQRREGVVAADLQVTETAGATVLVGSESLLGGSKRHNIS